jgi:hypothetical protein
MFLLAPRRVAAALPHATCRQDFGDATSGMETMRKELTAVSALSMLISFVAAIALCIHLAQSRPAIIWEPSGRLLWVVEIAVFGTAVYLWRRGASLESWVLGIAGLMGIRYGLAAFCAAALLQYQPGAEFSKGMSELSALSPRACAIFFSLMISYPLRAYLPLVLLPRRVPEAPAAAPEALVDSQSTWLVANPEGPAKPAKPTPWTAEDWVAAPTVPGKFGGSVEVPLRAIVSHIPEHLLTAEARQYPEELPIAIPLFLIGPQLKEARIHVRVDDLRDLLPPQVLAATPPTGSEGEPVVVSLALEDVIPALPAEVLELPPPSPPAWATYPDPDGVVSAAV